MEDSGDPPGFLQKSAKAKIGWRELGMHGHDGRFAIVARVPVGAYHEEGSHARYQAVARGVAEALTAL